MHQNCWSKGEKANKKSHIGINNEVCIKENGIHSSAIDQKNSFAHKRGKGRILIANITQNRIIIKISE